MNCAEFDACVNEELDASRKQQATDLAEHAAQCASCRATWEGFRLLADCIGTWRRETPQTDLADAVVFALRQSADPTPPISNIESRRSTISKQRRRQRFLTMAITGVAALLIVVALIPVLRRDAPLNTPVARVPTVQGNSAISDADRSNEDRGSTPQVVRRHAPQPETDRVPYYDLAQRAAGALGQMTMLVLPGETTPQNTAEEPPAEEPAGWMDDFGQQLKPVGRSLGNAFDFLWQAGKSVEG